MSEPKEFYNPEGCIHLSVLVDCVKTYRLRIESYEFNCRDSWVCKQCGTRIDPHVVLPDNYDIKG